MTLAQSPKVMAIVGSYRKGGIIDATVDEILTSAREQGAQTRKIYLIEKHIEFCSNCRSCTQQPGQERGKCSISDDMTSILEELEASDAMVLGSPMNFGTVTAVMKRFIERLVGYTYWQWRMMAPSVRNRVKAKRAIIVTSSAMPSLMGRLMTRIVPLLKNTASLLGAKTIGVLYIGFAASEEKQQISPRIVKRARKLGDKLVSNHRAR